MAEALAECGASIALIDKVGADSKAEAQRIAEQFTVAACGIEIDLAVESKVRSLPRTIAASLGGLDILVNNAAYVGTSNLSGWISPFEQQSLDTWRTALEVNLTACFALSQAAAPFLRKSGRGCIVNIGSIYGVLGPDMHLYEGTNMGNPAAYAASKGGLLQLTRWLATVLAPDVRVNCISPGGVWRNQPELFVERYVKRTPLGRMAAEEDFKGIVAFLASDLSSYVTGQHMLVDGGFSTW
jgi:NAD(P)-dependent dehydrogenase (short-subunit alcohol dehydrogenase family)